MPIIEGARPTRPRRITTVTIAKPADGAAVTLTPNIETTDVLDITIHGPVAFATPPTGSTYPVVDGQTIMTRFRCSLEDDTVGKNGPVYLTAGWAPPWRIGGDNDGTSVMEAPGASDSWAGLSQATYPRCIELPGGYACVVEIEWTYDSVSAVWRAGAPSRT